MKKLEAKKFNKNATVNKFQDGAILLSATMGTYSAVTGGCYAFADGVSLGLTGDHLKGTPALVVGSASAVAGAIASNKAYHITRHYIDRYNDEIDALKETASSDFPEVDESEEEKEEDDETKVEGE